MSSSSDSSSESTRRCYCAHNTALVECGKVAVALAHFKTKRSKMLTLCQACLDFRKQEINSYECITETRILQISCTSSSDESLDLTLLSLSGADVGSYTCSPSACAGDVRREIIKKFPGSFVQLLLSSGVILGSTCQEAICSVVH